MLLYVIEFPNGKRYIGITDRVLPARWRDHLKVARRGSRRPICAALRKYPDATIRPLVVGDREYIRALEPAVIAAFGTTDRQFGYNFGAGGDVNPMLGRCHTPEALAKIGEASRTRVRSAESKVRVSASLKGHTVSAETRARIRSTMARPEVRSRIGRPRKGAV